MKYEIKTEILIDAPAGRVWAILSDFEIYPEWNPLITSATGKPEIGEKVRIAWQIPAGLTIKVNVKVLDATPEKELRWIGSGPVPGTFDGEHYHIIEATGENQIRLRHGEIFKGLLVSPLKKVLQGPLTELYKEFNDALKARAEKIDE